MKVGNPCENCDHSAVCVYFRPMEELCSLMNGFVFVESATVTCRHWKPDESVTLKDKET